MAKSKATTHHIGPWWVNDVTFQKQEDKSDPAARYDLIALEKQRWAVVLKAKKALAEYAQAFAGVRSVKRASMRHRKDTLEFCYEPEPGSIGRSYLACCPKLENEAEAQRYHRAMNTLYLLEAKIRRYDGELEHVIRKVCPGYYENEGRELPCLVVVPINERGYWYQAISLHGYVSLEPYFFPNHRRERAVVSMPVDLNILEMRKQLKEGSAKWLLKEGRAINKKLYERR